MRRSTVGIILALALGCLVAPRAAAAQQPVKVYRIGFLGPTAARLLAGTEALRQGLRELGYVEGRNFTLEFRWAEGKQERLADLAAELVRLPVDLIVTHSTTGVRAARQATTTLPIVALDMTDPVEAGLVESVARPGGNLTGSFMLWRSQEVKRLELLKEALPGVTRVAVLLGPSPTNPTGRQRTVEALERTAQELGVALHPVQVHGPDDLERALSAIVHGQAEALAVSNDTLLILHAARIRDFVVAQRLPTIGADRRYLIAYTTGWWALFRRGAFFIDKILHGARPGDLPMERGVHFELMVDLKMAQELGVTISESLLMRADKVFPVSEGVPLPVSVRIVPPDRRIAPELAAFSGKWFGTWEGDRTQELILIVETIDPPQALVIVAWGNGTVGAGTADLRRLLSNWHRGRGQFVEGTLQVSYEGGTTSYRLQPDGTLAATLPRFRETSRTTMTRAQP